MGVTEACKLCHEVDYLSIAVEDLLYRVVWKEEVLASQPEHLRVGLGYLIFFDVIMVRSF